jgi:hypothetical protein
MKLQLKDSIASRQDFKALVTDIRKYARWLAQSAVKKQVAGAAATEQPAISQDAADLINGWQADKDTAGKGLDELVKALEEFEAGAQHVTITLAAPAPAKLRKDIVAWFRKNVGPDVLVDFKFNATMLGGMLVRSGSHVYDWSFKRQILANREKFPGVLRNV